MITVKFACGHMLRATGDEQGVTCGCGERRIVSLKAPAPRFVGHCTGPHASFENLPATAVTFNGDSKG